MNFYGGNIRHSDHHTDSGEGLFLSRIEWDLDGFVVVREAIAPIELNFDEIPDAKDLRS